MTAAATVLVTGPARAGVTSLVTRLRENMPGIRFVEGGQLQPADDPPAVVVFAVSAVAPVTGSDCALAARASESTDAVLAVLTKTDDHRRWRDVLDLNRRRLGAEVPRLGSVPWVGVAAAPRLGEPSVDAVVHLLAATLADPGLDRRNTLRGWEARIGAAIAAVQSGAAGRQAQTDLLAARRDALARARRLAAAQRAVTVRGPIQQARVELTCTARDRCATVRARLLEAAAEASRAGELTERVRRECGEVARDVDNLVSVRLQEVAAAVGVAAPSGPGAARAPRIGKPPVRSRRLETRLTTVVGAGFGFGAGLVVSRFLAGLAPGLTVAGSLVGAAVGLGLTLWVVGVRAVLAERAVLGQWIGEAAAAVRAELDERIAVRLLAAESAFTAERLTAGLAEDDAAAAAIAGCAAELADLARAAARAQALRRRCEPGLQRALGAVRYGLRTRPSPRTLVTDR